MAKTSTVRNEPSDPVLRELLAVFDLLAVRVGDAIVDLGPDADKATVAAAVYRTQLEVLTEMIADLATRLDEAGRQACPSCEAKP